MMGRRRGDQRRLFYEFHLDDRIPKNPLLRRIDVFVTAALADLHKELEPHYSDIGRPSVERRPALGAREGFPAGEDCGSPLGVTFANLASFLGRAPHGVHDRRALFRVCDRRRPVRDRHHLPGAVRQQYLHGKLQHDHHAPHGNLDHDRPRLLLSGGAMACSETERQGGASFLSIEL